MKRSKLVSCMAMLLLAQSLSAASQTLVLRQGVNNYKGCMTAEMRQNGTDPAAGPDVLAVWGG